MLLTIIIMCLISYNGDVSALKGYDRAYNYGISNGPKVACY